MTYSSKIDVWVLTILAIVPVSLLSAAIILRSAVPGVFSGLILVLYGFVLLPMNYRFGPEALQVRSGLIRTTIPYQAIRSVRATNNPFAGPALSLDRLEIAYGVSKVTLLSPRNQAAFLQDLSARVPGLDLAA